jgi:hypothetical protein
LFLTDSFEEDGQVVVVIQLHHVYFPENSILLAVLNCDWQVASVIETSELTWHNGAVLSCAGNWLLNCWLRDWL